MAWNIKNIGTFPSTGIVDKCEKFSFHFESLTRTVAFKEHSKPILKKVCYNLKGKIKFFSK